MPLPVKTLGFTIRILLVAGAAWSATASVRAAPVDLKPSTLEAFDRYVRLTEVRIDRELNAAAPFLWVDGVPEPRRRAISGQLRQGTVVIERLETLDQEKAIADPDGLIHHWLGSVFIPGTTLTQTLALVQNYDRHQEIYKPDVVRSKTLGRQDDDFRIYLRFLKKKILTVVLDTEHDVRYVRVDARRAYSRSRATRIAEVENAGKPDERRKEAGQNGGFLWRMNTYWRFEERDGGTYVQSESVSLTRAIPTGLGWLIGGFVRSIPRESLTFTLGTTRKALASVS